MKKVIENQENGITTVIVDGKIVEQYQRHQNGDKIITEYFDEFDYSEVENIEGIENKKRDLLYKQIANGSIKKSNLEEIKNALNKGTYANKQWKDLYKKYTDNCQKEGGSPIKWDGVIESFENFKKFGPIADPACKLSEKSLIFFNKYYQFFKSSNKEFKLIAESVFGLFEILNLKDECESPEKIEKFKKSEEQIIDKLFTSTFQADLYKENGNQGIAVVKINDNTNMFVRFNILDGNEFDPTCQLSDKLYIISNDEYFIELNIADISINNIETLLGGIKSELKNPKYWLKKEPTEK